MNGIFFALLTAIISGVSIYANSLFVTKTDPIVFAFWRNALVGAIFIGILIASGKISSIRKISKNDWVKLGIIGFVGGGLPFALFFYGLSKIGAIDGNIINKSLFLWVAVIAVIFLKEKLRWVSILGYGFVMFGLFSHFTPKINFGSLCVLTATILWAIEYAISKKLLSHVDSSIVSAARMIIGLPVLGLTALFLGRSFIIQPTIIGSLSLSTIFLILYMTSWYMALKKSPVSLVSSILVTAPLVTMVISAITSGKVYTTSQIIDACIVTVGVSLIYISSRIFNLRKSEVYG